MNKIFVVFSSLCLTTAALADAGMAAPNIPQALQDMKQLVGTWEGTGNMHGKDMPITVTYALTSGGTAILETLMPGTPQEMVSMYHKEGDSVAMTHYCAMGNQPHLALKQSASTKMVFEMAQPAGLGSADEAHMHAVTLTLTDANTLQQEWVSYANGQPKDTMTFVFKRKPTAP